MVYIALTFDYELFFNRSWASDREVLIDSTQGIVNMLKKANVLSTFFVDTCMLSRFEMFDYKETYEAILNQLKDISSQGHELGLHLHPIWNTAKYVDDTWCFKPENYMYRKDDLETIGRDIDYGVNLINSIYSGIANRRCKSFRAGGFSFYPEGVLYNFLFNYGIRIDSSVCKYRHQNAINQNYSYMRIPNKQYWFFNDGRIKEAKGSSELSMLEVPITATNDFFFKWISRYKYPNLKVAHKGEPSELLYHSTLEKKLDKISKKIFDGLHASLDGMSKERVLGVIEREYGKNLNKKSDDTYAVMIGHPKFQSRESLNNIENIISSLKHKYECDFVTLSDMYGKIVGNDFNVPDIFTTTL